MKEFFFGEEEILILQNAMMPVMTVYCN